MVGFVPQRWSKIASSSNLLGDRAPPGLHEPDNFSTFVSSPQVEVIPARDAIFDESFAAFRNLLLLFFCLYKLARVANRDGPGEAMRILDLVELTLDCLA